MSLHAGARLGPYEIVSAIGAGGMGEVYKARDTRLRREVAVKVLPASFSSDPDRLARFEQEARAAAALNHPNILAVHDLATEAGVTYLVSELLDGRTLRDALADPIPLKKAIDYAIQVANGLNAAHGKGIVHRDLKPENLFITADGRAKILDFGLAKLQDVVPDGVSIAATAAPRTQPGVVMGTAGYMSPEQVRGSTADHRADLFALGAVLYEMLSGRRAFARETGSETMTAILREEPPDVSSPDRPIPPAVERIVARCLEKDPSARFQSASDLAFALDALSSTRSVASKADVAPVSAQAARSASRAPWLVAAAAVLVAALLAVPAVRHLRAPAVAPGEMRLEIATPSTDDPTSVAISPDGRQVAFAAMVGGKIQIWLRRLDTTEARPLTGSEGATAPFWSPDGRAVGFFADGRVKRIDVASGAVQSLATATAGWGAAWNKDDVILYGVTAGGPLTRISASGAGRTQVTTLDPPRQTGHRHPQFLPDGKHFLYYAVGNAEGRGVYVASLDEPKGRRVLSADSAAVYVAPGFLLFGRQGTLVAQRFDVTTFTTSGEPFQLAARFAVDPTTYMSAASAADNGTFIYRESGGVTVRQFVWLDRAGTQTGTVGRLDSELLSNPELSPDGSRVAVDRTLNGNQDIWLIETSRDVATRFTFDAAVDRGPVWSPDGRTVVFLSARSGANDIYGKAANGTGGERVFVASPMPKTPESWSPDGKLLLFRNVDPKSGRDLWAFPVDGKNPPLVLRQTDAEEMHTQVSPDGRWLAFSSNESGPFEVYVQPFPSGTGTWQVSAGGGVQPRWSRDGRELFYIAPDSKLMAVPITVASDGQSVEPGRAVALFNTRIAGGAVVGIGRQQYDISKDGKRFLINQSVGDSRVSPITVVLNWASAPAK